MRNKQKATRRRWSIRTALIVVFTVFTAVALGCMLIFQIGFLDDLYEMIKKHSVRTAAEEIAAAIGTEDVDEYAAYWSMKEQCVIYITDSKGQVLLRQLLVDDEKEQVDPAQLQQLYQAAEENGGTYYTQSDTAVTVPQKRGNDKDKGGGVPPDGAPPILEKPSDTPTPQSEINTTLIYAYLTTDPATGDARMVAITSMLTPVNATVRTLLVQFVIAAGVLIGFAVLIAFIVARVIARPIVEVNRAAKTLVSDAYTAPPAGGYREIAELKETLAKTEVELRKAEQLQRELVSNLSHDLRTPLTMITGYSEAIRDLPGENSAENIGVIIDEAQRLTRLVNDVLDLSKLQSGTQTLSLVPTALCDAVDSVVARVRRMTEKDGYSIDMETYGTPQVMADEVRLSQVIYNLLLNALAYTGEDRRVTVTCETTGDCARVSFADSGKGIPADELERIWQRYYRVHKDEPLRDSMNSGLGLSIVKALVECHGGRCGVESTVGQGSTFFFELPLTE